MWLLLWSCVIGCVSHSLCNSFYRQWPFPYQPQPQDGPSVLPSNQFFDEPNLGEDPNLFYPKFVGAPSKSLPSRVVLLTYQSSLPKLRPGKRHYVFESDNKEINLDFHPKPKEWFGADDQRRSKFESDEEGTFWVESQEDGFGSEEDESGVGSDEDRFGIGCEESPDDRFSNIDTDEKGVTLDYKPSRPFYHPNPGNNIGQIVPSGKPWPANPEDYTRPTRKPTKPPAPKPSKTPVNLDERFKETTTTIKPVPTPATGITLDYKPSRPWFHPNPGNLIGQIVPPGKPWPANSEDYASFGGTSTVPTRRPDTTVVDLEDRLGESTEPTRPSRPQVTGITLDYKPSRPSYQPNPGYFVGQIVQPGKPWPANAEEYPSYMATRPTRRTSINLSEPQANEMTSPVSEVFSEPNLRDEILTQTSFKNGTEEVLPPKGGGENQTDNKLFGIPVPFLGQLIPNLPFQLTTNKMTDGLSSHKPETTLTTSNPTTSRPEEPTNNQPQTTTTSNNQASDGTTLIYKPQRPQYHPYPDDIDPIVPPGKPWPANPLNYTQNGGSTEAQSIVNDMLCSDKSCLHLTEVSKAASDSDPSRIQIKDETSTVTETKETAAATNPSEVSPSSLADPSHFSKPSSSFLEPSSNPPHSSSALPVPSTVSSADSSSPFLTDSSFSADSSNLQQHSSNPTDAPLNSLDVSSNPPDESSSVSVVSSSLPTDASSSSSEVSSSSSEPLSAESSTKSSSVLPLQLLNSSDQVAEGVKIESQSTEPAPFTSESRATQVKKRESEVTTLNAL